MGQMITSVLTQSVSKKGVYKRVALRCSCQSPHKVNITHHDIVSSEMPSLIYIAAIVFSLGHYFKAATIEAQEATCGLRYQDILKEAVSMRKRCDNAAYRDCCQV